MKDVRIIPLIIMATLISCALIIFGCTAENRPEPQNIDLPPQNSEAYYANLRAYKKSPHQIAFGWYGPSGLPNLEASMQNRWMGIPDSLDIISMWGGFPEKDSPGYKEMRFVQEVKGTKLILVSFSNDNFFNTTIKDFKTTYFDNQTKEKLKEGFDKIAKMIYDDANAKGIDGVDFDHEPNYCGCNTWQITKNRDDFGLFIEALGKYFGRIAGTGKMLLIDGEIDQVPTSAGKHVNYAVTQSYSTFSNNILQSRYDEISSWATPDRYIITENFESLWRTGGADFNDPVNGIIPSLYGMAYWNPTQGPKGGTGSYHIEYDYGNYPGYKYTRKMIQIMNPAPKPK
ncbi:glycoside hydrolase family 18 [Elizabethkingia anophelis]|uniref:glycoside hydrolase family 18 n=1 Tax=Elizabethkingia anophelis TaxID=1117645 RepID=UPI003555C5D2